MFLLDTDVLSALRRRERNPETVRWVAAQLTADLYLSVVTVGEIERASSSSSAATRLSPRNWPSGWIGCWLGTATEFCS